MLESTKTERTCIVGRLRSNYMFAVNAILIQNHWNVNISGATMTPPIFHTNYYKNDRYL